jgi:Concanavalin A-like lectin/glucanases superfamily/VanZ like family
LNLFKPPRIRLHLLGPAIAIIVAGTMVPIELRRPSLSYIHDPFDPADIFNNILLYMPLGIALARTSWLRALLAGLSLATVAETLQLGYVDRVPSFWDIASNTAGAVVGYLVARLFVARKGKEPVSLPLYRPLAAAAAPLAVLGTLALLHPRVPSDFSNWSPAFHLAAGNELTGNRAWSGTISGFSIYPFALSSPQIGQLAGLGDGSKAAAILGRPLAGAMGTQEGTLPFGRPLLSRPEELTLYQTLVKQNQLTLLVWFRTDSLKQNGPARIVTYSQDPRNRNFTLGQIGSTLTFRVRTPASGPNGAEPPLYTGPVLSLNHIYFVAATYDGRVSRLYVDGKLAAHADLGAERPRLPHRVWSMLPGSLPIRQIELCGAEVLLSGLFAIGIFAVSGVPPRRLERYLTGMAAGVAIGAIVWIFAVSDPWLGSRILLECVAAGWLISASVAADTSDVV